ncbi:MAG: saccharopine dehydrogenase NADP-binding domain-containing protein, partial [Pseudomonadales bacterium]|nr:saccharopine dehydrogenase NADP-binding domain-containing protein [Pseudomonadales bacterium]
MKSIVVLGGYGNFGKRIVEGLATDTDLCIYVAGRNLHRAEQLCDRLQSGANAQLKALCLDVNNSEFVSLLEAVSPFLVVHTCGPFQGQSYAVPRVCLELGAHYKDLADDRDYDCNIDQKSAAAKAKKLHFVTGASSVPGLSSAVIDHYHPQFSRIDSLD